VQTVKAAALLALVLRLHAAAGTSFDHLTVEYQIIGPFGGVVDFLRTQPGTTTYAVPLEYKGVTADRAKVIVYAPSSRFVLIEGGRELAERPLAIKLEPQKRVTITGTIDSIREEGLVVEARYVAPWAMSFFGYLNGPVPTFDIAVAPLKPDGSFTISLPQLSGDPVVRVRDDKDDPSHFELTVRKAKGWNIRAHLELENGRRLLAREPLPARIRCVAR
jgi:hypothetical protein